MQRELDAGIRETQTLGGPKKSDIEPGRFFIVGGQKAYVAEMGKEFTQDYGDKDARLRVVFDNGTESNMLRRSLQRALHKDEAGQADYGDFGGPAVCRPDRRRRRGQWHDLCAAEQHGHSLRRRRTATWSTR